MQTLETQLNMSRKQLDVARRMPSQTDLSEYRRQTDMLTQANQRLRDENAELNDEIEELRAMVESLKVRVAGNRDLTSSAISSPLMSHPSPIFWFGLCVQEDDDDNDTQEILHDGIWLCFYLGFTMICIISIVWFV